LFAVDISKENNEREGFAGRKIKSLLVEKTAL